MSQFRMVPVLAALAFSLFAVAASHASTVDVSVDVTPISGGLFHTTPPSPTAQASCSTSTLRSHPAP